MTFEDFVGEIRRWVPGFPGTPTPEFDVTLHGSLDHAQRSLLRKSVARAAPTVEQGAIQSCKTLGDLYAICGSQAAPERAVRGSTVLHDVALRPLQPADYGAIYQASLDPTDSFRWRYRGRTPSPEAFQDTLFADVLAQYAAVENPSGALLGLVSAYAYRPELRSCYLAALRTPQTVQAASGGEMILACHLLLDYLFANFDLRRVYLEVPEFNEYLVRGLDGSLLHLECRMSEQYWYGGQYWDMLTYYISRDVWSKYANDLFDASPA